MSTDSWKAGKGEMDLMKSLIHKFHPHLTLIEDEIVIIFKEKAAVKNGYVQDIVVSLAPKGLPLLTDKKFTYKFIMAIGADVWAQYSDRQKAACMDHGLCSIKFEEDPDKGTFKCSIKPPDFSVYGGEALRWGMWRSLEADIMKALDCLFKPPASTASPQKRVGIKPPTKEEIEALEDVGDDILMTDTSN